MTEYQVLWLNTTNTMTKYQILWPNTKYYDQIPNTMTKYQMLMTEYHEYHEYYNWILNTMTKYQMLWPNTTNTKYLWILIEVCSTYKQLPEWLNWLDWGLSHKRKLVFLYGKVDTYYLPFWESHKLFLLLDCFQPN